MPPRQPEDAHAEWEILKLRRKGDREKLEQLLIPRGGLSLAGESVVDYLLRAMPKKKIPLCRTVVVENEYFDEDFIGGISAFYSKGYRNIERNCKRLHFFSCDITTSDLTSLKEFADRYLGFCVIRPLGMKTVGRTVLKPRKDDPQFHFSTCCGCFRPNVAGDELSVDSAPYMEQDG